MSPDRRSNGNRVRGLVVAWAVSLVAILLLAGTRAEAAERRVALVVGNSGYTRAPPLPNPANDAQDVAAKLQQLGFTVIVRLDATKAALDAALVEFARTASSADIALFYFAGHGMQYQGRNYLLPVDAKIDDDLDVRFQLFALDDVRTAMDRVPGARLVVLDACRNNPLADQFSRSVAGTSRDAGSVRGLARVSQSRGSLVAFATQADEVARDGNGRNSPFTAALLDHIGDRGVEVGTLFRRVAATVNRETGGRQTPEVSISLLSEIYLNPEADDVAAWRTVQLSRNPAELSAFLTRYPDSAWAPNARAQLDLLARADPAAPGGKAAGAEADVGRREEALAAKTKELQEQKEALSATLAARDAALARAEAELKEREQRFTQMLAQREIEIRADVERQMGAASAADREKRIAQALDEARAGLTAQMNAALLKSQADRDQTAREGAEQARRLGEEVTRLQAELAKAREAASPPPPPPPVAETKVSSLETETPAMLSAKILGELQRIGCYAGPSTAGWTSSAAQAALRTFAKHDRSRVPGEPSAGFFEALTLKGTNFCQTVCDAGTVEKNGRCVAVQKPSAPPRARIAKPAPERVEPATRSTSGGRASSSRCFVFGGRQYCE